MSKKSDIAEFATVVGLGATILAGANIKQKDIDKAPQEIKQEIGNVMINITPDQISYADFKTMVLQTGGRYNPGEDKIKLMWAQYQTLIGKDVTLDEFTQTMQECGDTLLLSPYRASAVWRAMQERFPQKQVVDMGSGVEIETKQQGSTETQVLHNQETGAKITFEFDGREM